MAWILASNSPRRKEILKNLGLKFTIVPPEIDETPQNHELPEAYVRRMAIEKAKAVAQNLNTTDTDKIIIAADTIVVLENQILGKPRDATDAGHMLKNLSNKTHTVLTALCLIRGDDKIMLDHIETTAVTFRILSDEEIRDYVASGEPLDKAGAYALQGGARKFVTAIKGSESNVIGLPIEAFQKMQLALDKNSV